jgi:hypothetical protein
MTLFEIVAILLSLSALFSYVNARFIGLPTSIAVMAFSLAFSLVLVGINHLGGQDLTRWAEQLIAQVDLSETLLNGLLSFLLFAGGAAGDLGCRDHHIFSGMCHVAGAGLAHYSAAVYLLPALRRCDGAHRPSGGVGHS